MLERTEKWAQDQIFMNLGPQMADIGPYGDSP